MLILSWSILSRLGEDGSIARFDNSMVTRYLETVTVFDDRYEVNFKAGLTISVGVAVSAEKYH